MNPFLQNTLLAYQNLNNFNSLVTLLYQGQFQPSFPYSYPLLQLQFQPVYSPYTTEDTLFLSPQKTQIDTKGYYVELSDDLEASTLKTEDSSCKIEVSESQGETPYKQEESAFSESDSPLRTQIRNMVYYLLKEFGKARKEEVENRRKLYVNDGALLELFDRLVEKFSMAAKCREDMVRFVLRKTMSSLRDSLREKHKISAKKASIELCKKYFSVGDEKEFKQVASEEELLNFLLPYKKNSRNKTANSRFTTEIFSSKLFYEDYKEYLKRFDDILENENQKKVEKFVNFLESCVTRGSFKEIKTYKRLPWLKMWLEATRIIAHELLNNNNTSSTNKAESHGYKKVKTQRAGSKKAKTEEN